MFVVLSTFSVISEGRHLKVENKISGHQDEFIELFGAVEVIFADVENAWAKISAVIMNTFTRLFTQRMTHVLYLVHYVMNAVHRFSSMIKFRFYTGYTFVENLIKPSKTSILHLSSVTQHKADFDVSLEARSSHTNQ